MTAILAYSLIALGVILVGVFIQVALDRHDRKIEKHKQALIKTRHEKQIEELQQRFTKHALEQAKSYGELKSTINKDVLALRTEHVQTRKDFSNLDMEVALAMETIKEINVAVDGLTVIADTMVTSLNKVDKDSKSFQNAVVDFCTVTTDRLNNLQDAIQGKIKKANSSSLPLGWGKTKEEKKN